MAAAGISKLPDALLITVFSLLSDAPSRAAVRLTSRAFNQAALAVPGWWWALDLGPPPDGVGTSPGAGDPALASDAGPRLRRFLVRLAPRLQELTLRGSFAELAAPALGSLAGRAALTRLCLAAEKVEQATFEAVSAVASLASLELRSLEEDGGFGAWVHTGDLVLLSRLTRLASLRLAVTLVWGSRELPPELTRLQRLTALELSLSQMFRPGAADPRGLLAPPLASRLTALRRLTLGNARLALGEEEAVGAWQRLEALSLRSVAVEGGCLRALPSLPALTAVALGAGPLVDRPAEVLDSLAQCRGLQALALDDFQLPALPALAPGQLPALTSLSLGWCTALRVLPPTWCLPTLQELTLRCSPALAGGGWAAELGRLGALRALRLETLRLLELPDVVTGLTALTCLELNNNRLQSLPEGPYLASLRRLSLSANRLPRVPAALAAATQLQELDLSYNGDLSLRPAGLGVLGVLSGALRLLDLRGLMAMGGPQHDIGLDALAAALPGVQVLGPEV